MKYYVVWEGVEPGIYDRWEDAREMVENFKGAKYKSFSTYEDALNAFRSGGATEGMLLLEKLAKREKRVVNYDALPEIDKDAWAVDASCMGNPGVMEYRGVEVGTGKEIFRVGPFQQGTNNIGEFLALVHAISLSGKMGMPRKKIYSDSKTAMSWLKNRAVKTTLRRTVQNAKLFELLERALNWIKTNPCTNPVEKWKTEEWGEVPADFGRK